MAEVVYRPVEEEHKELFYKWFNESELTSNFYYSLPSSQSRVEKFIRAEVIQEYPLTFIQYVDGEPIGFFRLHDLSFINRKVEITLAVAEKTYQGQGYGKQLLHRTLRYAFYELNLEQVYLYVYKPNTTAVRLYESFGFVKEGEIRVLKYHLGRPVSGYRMSVFTDECIWPRLNEK